MITKKKTKLYFVSFVVLVFISNAMELMWSLTEIGIAFPVQLWAKIIQEILNVLFALDMVELFDQQIF